MKKQVYPTTGQTAEQVIATAYETNPGRPKLAKSVSGEAIGSWDEAQQRFVMVAGRIDDFWASMPMEVWVNGKPAVSEWVEIPA